MIYLFWGDNQYAKDARIQQLIDEHIKEHGEDGVQRLDGEELGASEVQNLTAQSLFAEHRFLIIKDLSMNKKVAQAITEVITRIPDTTDVVFSEQKVKKNTIYFKTLSSAGESVNFSELSIGGLVDWVGEKASKMGGKIDKKISRQLVMRAGNNQLILLNEIKKLLEYNPTISSQSIEILVDKKPQDNIFDLLDNIAGGSTAEARMLYRDLRMNQAEPHYVISMIGWQLNNMATVVASKGKTAHQIASDSGISPFIAQKTLRLTRNMDLKTVGSMINVAANTDLALKTTTAQPDQLVEQLIDRLGFIATNRTS